MKLKIFLILSYLFFLVNSSYAFQIIGGGGSGDGSGDVLSTNNLSDLTNPTTARTNLGLGNVNNTADIDKPISTATQLGLDAAKVVSGAVLGNTLTLTRADATTVDIDIATLLDNTDAQTITAFSLNSTTNIITITISGGNTATVDLSPVLGAGGLADAPSDGSVYGRQDGSWVVVSGTGAVDSVNTQTGAVVLDADDIDDTSTANKFTSAADVSRLANTSGTNTGDQDLSGLMEESNIGTGPNNYIQLNVDGDLPFAIGVDATGFDGNLATTDDTLQKVAQKVDDLTVSGGASGYVVTPWTYSDEACTAGQYSIDGSALRQYLCVASGNIDYIGATGYVDWDSLTPDTTPDAFTFVDQTDVALTTLITSAPITVAGINSASPITVTGGTYDINASGTFVSTEGTVANGDTVRAQHTSSGVNSTTTDTTVTIGGMSDPFTSTTLAASGGTAFFESNWDGVTATDEVCAEGCPDTWNTLSDATFAMSIDNGELTQTITSNTSVAFLRIGNSVGQPLEAFPDEYWYEYTVKFSRIDGFAANGTYSITDAEHISPAGIPGHLLKADASGVLSLFTARAQTNTGQMDICSNTAFSPSANTSFTVKYHWKKGDGDGQAHINIAGVSCSNIGINSDAVTGLKFMRLGGSSMTIHNGTNNFTVKYDNFKLYTTDPGWTW